MRVITKILNMIGLYPAYQVRQIIKVLESKPKTFQDKLREVAKNLKQ